MTVDQRTLTRHERRRAASVAHPRWPRAFVRPVVQEQPVTRLSIRRRNVGAACSQCSASHEAGLRAAARNGADSQYQIVAHTQGGVQPSRVQQPGWRVEACCAARRDVMQLGGVARVFFSPSDQLACVRRSTGPLHHPLHPPYARTTGTCCVPAAMDPEEPDEGDAALALGEARSPPPPPHPAPCR